VNAVHWTSMGATDYHEYSSTSDVRCYVLVLEYAEILVHWDTLRILQSGRPRSPHALR
jgi:hypothetical protein